MTMMIVIAIIMMNVVGASIAAVDKGLKREGVRFKLIVQLKEPGSKDWGQLGWRSVEDEQADEWTTAMGYLWRNFVDDIPKCCHI